MCAEVLTLDGRQLDTVQDLADYLGPEHVARDPAYSDPLVMASCLCQVDLDESFRRAGRALEWPEHRGWAYERPRP